MAQRLAVYADDIAEWLNELLNLRDPELTGPTLMVCLRVPRGNPESFFADSARETMMMDYFC